MTTGHLGDKEKPMGDPPRQKQLRPRDAATLIIVDRTGADMRVLMGKRRMEQAFMPGKYVFPGGRVDKTDRHVPSIDELSEMDTANLLLQMKGVVSGARARALALAAIRETFEEAGIVVGAAASGMPTPKAVQGWAEFFANGFVPRLSPLTFFARAITPPGRTRRYDTRFFYMDANAIAHRTDTSDGELSGLHWLTVEEARELDVPVITRVVLDDLMDHIRSQGMEGRAARVPFYHHSRGSFRRDMLPAEQSES